MTTTLNKIRAHNPCPDVWAKLLAHLGKTEADDEPLSLLTILEGNGIDDALWALRAVDGHDREMRLFACDCAESVLHLCEDEHPNDSRVRDCIDTARRYANGRATYSELQAARDAAWDAAWAAAWAARDAARDAAWDAAWAAAWDAAWAFEREKQQDLFIKMVSGNE